jgi:hypothetical protein
MSLPNQNLTKFLLAVLLPLLISCNKSGDEFTSNLLIEDGRVGQFVLGESVPPVGQYKGYEVYASAGTLQEEGNS